MGARARATYHLVEARRVLEAVADLQESALLVLLLRPDQVQLDRQLRDVRPEMLDGFQTVRKVTEKRDKILLIFFFVDSLKKATNNRVLPCNIEGKLCRMDLKTTFELLLSFCAADLNKVTIFPLDTMDSLLKIYS